MVPPWSGFRDALKALTEVVRAGLPDPDSLPDGGFDPVFVERTAPLLEFFFSTYFRVRIEGLENVPSEGPALLVANHSGGVPYDGAMLIHALHTRHPAHRFLRTLVANFALRSRWMTPVIGRVGGMRASMDNGLKLLGRGEVVGAFPEGLRGVGKLYRERYRLTHFGRGGFVRLARAARVPIIPVAIVGAEETYPVLGKLTRVAKPLGLPYIPITPTFPLLGPLGLMPVPTKWSIRIAAPIAVPPQDDSTADTLEIAEAIRRRVDEMIFDLLLERRSIFFG